jgi:RNA polymerase sigma factor (sigma-70 family)
VREADAEDYVQDTFLRFLHGLDAYRGEASLETYLFLLLRRRIIDAVRGPRVHACAAGEGADDAGGADQRASDDPSASWYVRRDEARTQERAALAQSMIALVETLRQELNFRDLQLVEMLFYAQMRNEAIAGITGLDNKYIGLLKHRWIKQLRSQVAKVLKHGEGGGGGEEREDSLLSEIWEQYRPSCPKRTTLGGYLLGTLDEPWTGYIKFHVETLGCRFCTANLDDLRRETEGAQDAFRERVLQSTVGFFRGS